MWTTLIVCFVLILVAIPLWGRRRKAVLETGRQQAMLQFVDRWQDFKVHFLQQAAATGKPRGLRWMACDFQSNPLFATDPDQSALFALVAATIRFEAIEGGDMEEVEAVGNLRGATAVFVFRNGHWYTDGRVVFNLDPAETCAWFHLTGLG